MTDRNDMHVTVWHCVLLSGFQGHDVVARITYTVLVETLNHAQSINQSINQSRSWWWLSNSKTNISETVLFGDNITTGR